MNTVGDRHIMVGLVLGLGVVALSCSEPDGDVASPTTDAGTDSDDQKDGDDKPTPCEFDIDCAMLGTICIEGACIEARCQPNGLSCLNEDIVQCNAAGDNYALVESCERGLVCNNARCVQRVCEPGEVLCEGNSRKECNTRGTGFDTLPCFGDRVCFRGECLDPVCSPGKTICLDDLSQGICEDNGGGYRSQLCGFARRCLDGRCAPFHALNFAGENTLARARAPVRRPDEGFVAIWFVLDEMPEVPVQLLAWSNPVGAGLTAAWDPASGLMQVVANGEAAIDIDLPLRVSEVVHLTLVWDAEGIWALRDGYLLNAPGEAVASGGTPTDSLTLGRYTSQGRTWPGRISSVWVGSQIPTPGFVPRCDGAPEGIYDAAWHLDEGDGTQAASEGEQVPPFVIEGAQWGGGLLGRYARDADEDDYGYDVEAQISCGPINDDDVLRLGDCNDANANVYPGAPETADQIDNDCDGTVDESD